MVIVATTVPFILNSALVPVALILISKSYQVLIATVIPVSTVFVLLRCLLHEEYRYVRSIVVKSIH